MNGETTFKVQSAVCEGFRHSVGSLRRLRRLLAHKGTRLLRPLQKTFADVNAVFYKEFLNKDIFSMQNYLCSLVSIQNFIFPTQRSEYEQLYSIHNGEQARRNDRACRLSCARGVVSLVESRSSARFLHGGIVADDGDGEPSSCDSAQPEFEPGEPFVRLEDFRFEIERFLRGKDL